MQDIEKKISGFNNSNYIIAAVGMRDVSYSELSNIFKILLTSSPDAVGAQLNTLYKYHPDTVALNKSFRVNSCCRTGGGVDADLCNCFLPDVEHDDYYCVKQRVEKRENSNSRNYPEYHQWRLFVFERDEYTCQECGGVGGELNAHHIKPYAKYPDLRLDINNGTTLCVSCHKKKHSKKSDAE